MKIKKTRRHVMLEKIGYSEPFMRFCQNDVIILDAEAICTWNNSDSSHKIQLISNMMKGAGIVITATPIIYDPKINDQKNTEDVFYSILKELYIKTSTFRRQKF